MTTKDRNAPGEHPLFRAMVIMGGGLAVGCSGTVVTADSFRIGCDRRLFESHLGSHRPTTEATSSTPWRADHQGRRGESG
jgi:hypothetical protein